MRPSVVRKVFIFFIFFLPAQYALVGIMGHYQMREHWPAFVFPGFKNVFDGREGISLDSPIIIARYKNGMEELSVPELLFDIPYSHHRAVMSRRFGPEVIDDLDADSREWLQKRLTALTNEYKVHELEIVWNAYTYQIIDGDVNLSTDTISRNSIFFNE